MAQTGRHGCDASSPAEKAVLEVAFMIFADQFPDVLDQADDRLDRPHGDGHQRAESNALRAKALVDMVDRGEIELEWFMTEPQLRELERLGHELLDVDSDLESVLATG
jgi:hypothetical protein